MYLSHTGSGRFLATLVAAGVLLLLAASPRPIIPTEPERMVRRSPLEHAEALGQAYLDVTATRTATDRLVSGLRRRTERVVPSARGGDQRAFLQAIVRHTPSLAPQVGLLERGLSDQIAPREFAHLADALGEIERALLKSPSTPA